MSTQQKSPQSGRGGAGAALAYLHDPALLLVDDEGQDEGGGDDDGGNTGTTGGIRAGQRIKTDMRPRPRRPAANPGRARRGPHRLRPMRRTVPTRQQQRVQPAQLCRAATPRGPASCRLGASEHADLRGGAHG